uniref:TPR_REGION domain-containing protein n=1 Tax=Panagrellus redivivus TaxID=6233 RepID=A0A7E4VUL2_PANRE
MSISIDNAGPPPTSTGGSISMTAIEVNVKPPTDADPGAPPAKPRVQFSDKVQRFPESAPTSPHATSPKVTQPPDVVEAKSVAPTQATPASPTPTQPTPTPTESAPTHPATIPEKPENDETPSLSIDIQVGAAPPSFDAAIEVLHDKPLTGPGSNVVIEVNSPLPEAAANVIPALTSPVTPPPQTTSSEPAQENNLPSRTERSGLITHAILNVEMVREPKEPPKNQDEWDADTAKIFFAVSLFEKSGEAGAPEKVAAASEPKTETTTTEQSITATEASVAEQSLNSVTQPKPETVSSAVGGASATSEQTKAEAEPAKTLEAAQPTVNEQKQDVPVAATESSAASASVETTTEVNASASIEQTSTASQKSTSETVTIEQSGQKDAANASAEAALPNATPVSAQVVADSASGANTTEQTPATTVIPEAAATTGSETAEPSATSVPIPVNIDQASAAQPATEPEKPPVPAAESPETTVPAPNAEPVSIPVNIDLAQGPQPSSESTTASASDETLKKVDLSPLLASTPSSDEATLNALANARTSTQSTTEATHADIAVNIDVGEQKTAPSSETPANDNVSATAATFDTLPETTANVDVKIERVQVSSHASDANETKEVVIDSQQQPTAQTDGLAKPADNASAEVTHSNENVEVVAAPIRVESNQSAPPAAETATSEAAKSTDATNVEQKTDASATASEQTATEETIEIPIRFETEGEAQPSDATRVTVTAQHLAELQSKTDAGKPLPADEETIEIPIQFESEAEPNLSNTEAASVPAESSTEIQSKTDADVANKPSTADETIEIPIRFETEAEAQPSDAARVTVTAQHLAELQSNTGAGKPSPADEETIEIPIQFETEAEPKPSKSAGESEEETIEIPIRFETEAEAQPSDAARVTVTAQHLTELQSNTSAGKPSPAVEETIEIPIQFETEAEPKPSNPTDEELIEIPIRFETEGDTQPSDATRVTVTAQHLTELQSNTDAGKPSPVNEETVEIPIQFEGTETEPSKTEEKPVLEQSVDVPISTGDDEQPTKIIVPQEETIEIPVRFEDDDKIVDIPIEVEAEPETKPPIDAVQENVVNIAIGEDAEQIVDIPIEVEQDAAPKAPEGPAPVLEQVVNIPLAVEEDAPAQSINIPIEVELESAPKAPADAVLEQVVNVPISGDDEKIVDIPIEIEGDEPKPASDTAQQPAPSAASDNAATPQGDQIVDIPIEVEGDAKPAAEVPGAVVENVVNVAINVDDKAAPAPETAEVPITAQNAAPQEASNVEENVVQIPVITLNGEVHPESVKPVVPEVKPEEQKPTEPAPASTETPQQQSTVTEPAAPVETTPATVEKAPETSEKAAVSEVATPQAAPEKAPEPAVSQESSVPKEVAELATQIADTATAEAVKTVDGTSAPGVTDEITVQTTFAKPLFEDNAQTKTEIPPVEPAKDDEIKFQTTFAKPMDSNPTSPVPAAEKSPKADGNGEVSFQSGFAKPLTEAPSSDKPKEVSTDDSGVSWTEVPAGVNKVEEQPKSPVKDSSESQIQTSFAKPLLAEPEPTKVSSPTQKDAENKISQTGFAKPLLQDAPAASSPIKSVPPPLIDDEDDFWTEVPPNAVVRDIPIKVVAAPPASQPSNESQIVTQPIHSQPEQTAQTSPSAESKQVEPPKSPASVQQPKPVDVSDEIEFYEVPKGHDTAIEPPAQSPAPASAAAAPASPQKTNANDALDLNIDQYEAQLKKNTKEALALVDRLVDEATAHGQQQASQYKSRPDGYSPPHDRRPRTSSQSPPSRKSSVPNSPFSENKLVEAQSYRVNPELLGDATAVAMLPDFRLVLADLEKGLTVFNLYTKEQKRFECSARFRNPLCLYHLPRPKEILVLCEYSENSDGNFGLYICRFTYDLEYVNRVEAPKFLEGKEISTYRMAFCLRTGCLYLAASAYNTGYLYEFSPEGFWTEVYTGRNKHFTDIAIFAVIGPVTEIMLVDSIKDYVVVVSVYNSEQADQRVLAASEKPTSLCIDECGHVIIFDRYSNKVGIHSRLTNLRYHDIALVEHSKCRLAAFAGLLAVLSPTKKELRIYKY